MQTVNTNSFRIVPVCVPSVRKWGAYNMATIIDKFDFKFANRVTINFLGPRGPLVLPLVNPRTRPPVRNENLDPMYTGIYAS